MLGKHDAATIRMFQFYVASLALDFNKAKTLQSRQYLPAG